MKTTGATGAEMAAVDGTTEIEPMRKTIMDPCTMKHLATLKLDTTKMIETPRAVDGLATTTETSLKTSRTQKADTAAVPVVLVATLAGHQIL